MFPVDLFAHVRLHMQRKERPAPGSVPDLEPITEGEKAAALAILKDELEHVRKAMGHESISAEEYAETAAAIEKEFIYLPSRQRYERSASATNSDRLESIQVEPLCVAAVREMVRVKSPLLYTRQGKLDSVLTLSRIVARQVCGCCKSGCGLPPAERLSWREEADGDRGHACSQAGAAPGGADKGLCHPGGRPPQKH